MKVTNNKYHNKKVTTADGITHDSKREANRWLELRLMERAGVITELQRQVKFVLIPAKKETVLIGKKTKRLKYKVVERECSYRADFTYKENGTLVVEDAKGVRTKDYAIKKKMMLFFHGIRIKEG